MKYYVQNGDTKIVIQTDTAKEAAINILHRIIKGQTPNLSLLTIVSEAGFIEDLIEFQMINAMDKGDEPYLTSSLLYEMAENFYDQAEKANCEDENEEDALYEKCIRNGDICTKLMDKLNLQEEKIIQTDTKEADLICELSA